MTPFDLLALVVIFLSALAAGSWLWERLRGPDPDLESSWDPRDSWFGRQRCVCGRWRDEVNHVHAGWQERHR